MAPDPKLTVTLPWSKWERILRHLDAPVTGGEGQTLAHAIRRPLLEQVAGK